MLAGHFALGAAVKARQPQIPAWSLMLVAQLLDLLFLGTYAAGVEWFSSAPGTTGGYGNLIINADYTHSLVGALAISFAAAIVTSILWGRRNGMIVGAVVMSHWLLDLLVHRADMPVLPGNAYDLPRLGLGLWQWPWVVIAIELGLCLAGAYLYYHSSARMAIQVERRREKAGEPAGGYRQNATISAIVMAVALLGTLAADVLFG